MSNMSHNSGVVFNQSGIITSPNDVKKNSNFKNTYFNREWLAKMNKDFPKGVGEDNIIYWTLCLLSCGVEFRSKEDKERKKFQRDFYLYSKVMARILGVKNYCEVIYILDMLKKAGIIKYRCSGSSLMMSGVKIEVQFIKLRKYVGAIRPDRSEEEKKKHIDSVVYQKGFFYIALSDFIKEMMALLTKVKHGHKDTAIILLNNIVYKDEECENEDIYNHHIVQFGNKYFETNDGDVISENNYVIKVKELAKYLNISYSALNEMLDSLQARGYIRRRFVRNRGTVIVFSAFDLDKDDDNYDETLERIFTVLTLESYKYSVKRISDVLDEFNFLNRKRIKKIRTVIAKRKDDIFGVLKSLKTRVVQTLERIEREQMTEAVLADVEGFDVFDDTYGGYVEKVTKKRSPDAIFSFGTDVTPITTPANSRTVEFFEDLDEDEFDFPF